MQQQIGKFVSGIRAAAPLVALLASGAALIGADAPTGGDPRVRTFVLSNIYIASSGDAGKCPMMADGGLESFFHQLPAEERAKYASASDPNMIEEAKRGPLEKLMDAHYRFLRLSLRGTKTPVHWPAGYDPKLTPTPKQALEIGALNGFPKGRGRLAFSNVFLAYSACSNPEDFPMLAKGFRTYDGKVAPGIDLDGKAGREDFTGLDGTKGVDNQLWRAVGCVKPFREYGEPEVARKIFISARAPTVIELRGVDDLRNDPDVEVRIAAATDPVTRDGKGDALAGATFALDPDPRLRAVTHGRIVDGVLTTNPVDLLLSYKEQIVDAPREIRGARIRAVLNADGSITGRITGYYTLDSYWRSIEQMTQNGANLTGVSCPGVKQAIERLADGYKDAKTGRYTAISSAYDFFGVHAFAVEPQTAGSGGL